MTLRQRLEAARRQEDRGAALVIALIFVTVVAVTVAAILAYVDANMRATMALREQAAIAAAADAAAELAINELRESTYEGGACDDFDLPPYSAPGNKTNVAKVTCELDPDTTQEGSTGSPSGYALLALQNNVAERSIDIKVNGSGAGINVAGDVGSAGSVVIDHGTLNVAGGLTAKSCSGSMVASPLLCDPSAPSLTEPTYQRPAAPGPGTVPSCTGSPQKLTFQPGIYKDLTLLNRAWSNCNSAQVYDFRPGVYYFGFAGVWRINKGTMVAGATNPLGTTAPSVPGACPNPVTGNIGATDGVTFVFGNQAQMLLTGTARMEICGREAPSGSDDPPIAMFGLDTTVNPSTANEVLSQRECVTRFSGGGPKCAVFSTDNQADSVRYYIQGHVFQPRARVDLDLRKSSDQFFNGGLTVRAFNLFSPASSTPPTPVSSGPEQEFAPGRTMVLLTVYVCPSTPCGPGNGGRVKLRVKVGIGDPDGDSGGPRTVTVYNWGVVR